MTENLRELLDELRQTMGKMEVALGVISESIVWTDSTGKLAWCNDRFTQFIGRPRFTFLGKPVVELLPLVEHGTPVPPEAHPVNLVLQNQSNHVAVYQSGDRSFRVTGSFVRMKGDEDVAVLVVRDVTEELEYEQTRIMSAALEASVSPMMTLNPDGTVQWVNPAYTAMTGWKLDEIWNREADFWAEKGEVWATVLAGESWEGELESSRKNGEQYFEYMSITPVLDPEGDVTHVIAIRQDISERKAAETRIMRSEQRFRTLFQQANDSVFLLDAEGQFKDINRRAEDHFGDCNGCVFHDLGPKGLRTTLTDSFQQAVMDDGGKFEAILVRKDGARMFSEISVTVSGEEGDRVIQCVVRDVTRMKLDDQIIRDANRELTEFSRELEKRVQDRTRDLEARTRELFDEVVIRKEAEAQVLESEEILQASFEGVRAAIMVLDADSHEIVRVNAVASELLGFEEGELMGSLCQEILPELDGNNDIFTCPADTDTMLHREGRLRRGDGSIMPIMVSVLQVEQKGRRLQVLVLFDITERKNLERQLTLAQKLESVGMLATGIAHEINSPSQFAGDSVRFIQEANEDFEKFFQLHVRLVEEARQGNVDSVLLEEIDALVDDIDLEFLREETPKACARAVDGISRITEIVRAMKRFSHPDDERRKFTDVNEAIKSTVTVTRNEWRYVADIQFDLDEGMPAVPMFPGGMNQVFLNILVNAAHAIGDVVEGSEEKGVISISSRAQGDWAVVAVTDTGTGMNEDVAARVFDPFYTTKDVGKGTGQGLAIAYDIVVEGHGGSSEVETAPGAGTTFTIRLPLEIEPPTES